MPPYAVLCVILSLGMLACSSMRAAFAADCPGHPGALGTSRTLVVDPREHPRIGTMQYPETLPLRDHEVVLSFDDGPLPRNSDRILAILAAQCIKANFFLVGEMARSFPEGVRKLRDAGHTIGTHSQTHPLTMNKMPIERAKAEINDGIASVKAALGADADKSLAPFFRIPGLSRAKAVEDYLASQGIQVWSADFPADDWRHISSSRVYDLAIKRIEAKGKGILLLHDIQPRTVAALPRILETLKARGYHIVHVVPATPDRPATPTEPQQWQLHPSSENVATSHWPEAPNFIPNFVFANADQLAAPAFSYIDAWGAKPLPSNEMFADRRARGIPLPGTAPWPRHWLVPAADMATTLPIAARSVFELPDLPRLTAESVARLAPAPAQTMTAGGKPERIVTAAGAGHFKHAIRGQFRSRRGKPLAVSRRNGRGTTVAHGRSDATHTHGGPARHLAQVRKRSV
ncbi:MAG: polysaccharide deacetylase family protein [Bradyrhizobium sp.]|nr:polysaccharide deacetylase family protein [Bradyrhizobium sp.]